MVKKYKIHFDSYGLPIQTREYVISLVEEFLGPEYDPDNWEDKIGKHPNRDRRIMIYAVRLAARAPETSRLKQLVQLCRKYIHNQPRFWPRFLRERYQYANTKDFFSVDYNDIIWEYYSYEDEMNSLGADPNETGRVFDAAPQWKELMETVNKLAKQMTVSP